MWCTSQLDWVGQCPLKIHVHLEPVHRTSFVNKDFAYMIKVRWGHIGWLLLFSHTVASYSLRPHELWHARPPCPSPTPGVCSDSRPSCPWCHPTISSSVVPVSSCLQSFPASGSFPKSQVFRWGGQRIGASASASVLPMNGQGWSPLGLTGWLSLQSKELSRVFSNTTVQKHQLLVLSLLYGPALTSVHNYWENRSFD